jgi:hypothetical protein
MSCLGENQIHNIIMIIIIIILQALLLLLLINISINIVPSKFKLNPSYFIPQSQVPKTNLRHWTSLAGCRRSNQDLRSGENASVAVKQATKGVTTTRDLTALAYSYPLQSPVSTI